MGLFRQDDQPSCLLRALATDILFVALTRHFIAVIDWAANMPVIGLGLLASGLGL